MQWWVLWANVGRSASQYMRRSGSLRNNWFLITALVGIALFWLGLFYWDRYRKRFPKKGGRQQSLFLELCQAHQLARRERTLLQKAAETVRLNQPALLFVDPDILGGLARSSTPDAPAYRQLRSRLFGDGLFADASPGTAKPTQAVASEQPSAAC